MKSKKILAIMLIGATTMSSLTGCSSLVGKDVTKYPLVNRPTQQEIIDFYAEGLKYDAQVKRNVEVDETTYVEQEVTGEKKDILLALQKRIQDVLSNKEYTADENDKNLVTEDEFAYIKSYLNSNKLTNGTVKSVTGALGYYFVDVEYDVSAAQIGTFKDTAKLLGINGIFHRDYRGIDGIDSNYAKAIVNKLNDYYMEQGVMKVASFDEGSLAFLIADGDPSTGKVTTGDSTDTIYLEDANDQALEDILSQDTPQSSLDSLTSTEEETEAEKETTADETTSVDDTSSEEETTATEETEADNYYSEPVQESNDDNYVTTITSSTYGGTKYNSYTAEDRKCSTDARLINQVVGSSYRQRAYIPHLDVIYNVPDSEGDISGLGVLPSGGDGLAIFGYHRSDIEGKCTLRYVFKDASDASGNVLGINVYPKSESITTGFNTSDGNVTIPDFLRTKFEILLDRADRANLDCLVGAMVSGDIYEDMGFAVLRGYEKDYVNVQKHMSTIRQIIARDNENNAYLVEIETTRTEGPKSADTCGTYRDKSYIVIQQRGTDFIITDQMRVNRKLVKEPAINPDASALKRLVSLNLSGSVTDEAKQSVQGLLDDWYKACTVRKAKSITEEEIEKGENKVNYKGQEVEITRGMEDCFDNETDMLSSKDKDYILSGVQGRLTKYGSDTTTEMKGTVTGWMGGYDNQVEFTTEELFIYEGKNEALYQTVYYLATNMQGSWVFDERTVLSEEKVTGNDIQTIESRLK